MSKKLWGGRFKKKIDREFEEFQKSIQYDYKLAQYDILHSLIHVAVLKEAGILTKEEANKLFSVLKDVQKQIKEGKFRPSLESEDIHTDIQDKVEKRIGKLASKLHTLRSRNDQIIFDEKHYCLEAGVNILELLLYLLESLLVLMKKYKNQPFVGYTHTQRAQVVLFIDYLGAFFDMFRRDDERVKNFSDHLFIYVGAGALAGSSLKRKDYNKAIKELLKDKQFEITKPVENPLDNISDRDFIIEFLSILSILQMHLSRLAEDLILYSTKEFSLLDLPEEFCTGSSLMPHKKNPDFLELVRGYTGRVYGNLISILTTMKGLPLTYNRDMQLDKEPLFSSVEIIKEELRIMAKLIKGIRLDKENINKALEDESLYATELAEFLVFKGVAFKEAHTIVGKLIRYSEDKKIKIKEMPDRFLKTFHKKLTSKDVKKIMNPRYAVSSKKSIARRKLRLPSK